MVGLEFPESITETCSALYKEEEHFLKGLDAIGEAQCAAGTYFVMIDIQGSWICRSLPDMQIWSSASG